MQKIYVTGSFTEEQLNTMSGPHKGCADSCKLVEYSTGEEHEHEARCADDCVAHRLFDWWYGSFESDGRFFGIVIPRARDWECRRRLQLAGFTVFPSQHSPDLIEADLVRSVSHAIDGFNELVNVHCYRMRDVALALHAHYGHPALHPDA